MAINVLTPYKLTKQQKKALLEYMEGRKGIREISKTLGVSNTRIYVMVATITRHASTTGSIDAKTLLSKY